MEAVIPLWKRHLALREKETKTVITWEANDE